MMTSKFARRFIFSAALGIACCAAGLAQDSGQVLRVSVGYGTMKNTPAIMAKLTPETRAEVDRLPVVILGSVQKLFLERLGCLLNNELVGLPKRQVPIGALQSAVSLTGQEKRAEPHPCRSIDRHHGGPAQRRFQVERTSLIAEMVEIRAGDLRYHRLQFWPGVGSHGPLDKAKVTATQGGQLARKPLLLLDPRYGGQSIVVLMTPPQPLSSYTSSAVVIAPPPGDG